MELNWLKKAPDALVEEKRQLIDTGHKMLSVSGQCELLGMARSSYYYRSEKDKPRNHFLMNMMDEQLTKTPLLWGPHDDDLAAADGAWKD